jgi:transcriptional regulator with XRE-family HTH domain
VTTFNYMWKKLSDREYRAEFASAQFKRLVPFQIRALRKQRGWTQEQLAEKSKLTQGVISRAEDSDNGNLTANTILRIADGFDVAFVGRFVSYGELEEWFRSLTETTVRVPSFDEEDRLLNSGMQVCRRKFLRGRKRRAPEEINRLRKRAVYIDTLREVVPQTAFKENQLPLPLSSPGSGADSGFWGVPARALGDTTMNELVQNVPPRNAKVAGGF